MAKARNKAQWKRFRTVKAKKAEAAKTPEMT
jgi:hypothetical protein